MLIKYLKTLNLKSQFHTSNLRNIPRMNPILWGKGVDGATIFSPAIPPMNECYENLKKSMGSRFTPVPAHVELKKYDFSDVVEFETPNSDVNIWSVDLVLKLYYIKALANSVPSWNLYRNKPIYFVSKKPHSFIHQDDYEFFEKMTEDENHIYFEMLDHFRKQYMRWQMKIAFISGPCMDGGFDFLKHLSHCVIAENSNVCFGMRQFNKCNLMPAGYQTYFSTNYSQLYVTANMMLNGMLITPRQFSRMDEAVVLFNKKNLKDRKASIQEYSNILPTYHSLFFTTSERDNTHGVGENDIHEEESENKRPQLFSKSKQTWWKYLVTLLFIPYFINFTFVLFIKRSLGLSWNLKILNLFQMYCQKLYNNLFRRDRAFYHEKNLRKKYKNSPKCQYKFQLFLRELKISKNLPTFNYEIPRNFTIFTSDLNLAVTDILFYNIAREFGCDIKTVTNEQTQKNLNYYIECLSRDLVDYKQSFVSATLAEIIAPFIDQERRISLHHQCHKFSSSPETLTDEYILQFQEENLEKKKKEIEEIEQKSLYNCLILSHTLSIPVKKICQSAVNPQNIMGFNFGLCVKGLEYVEICTEDKPTDSVKKALAATYFHQFRNVIFVRDTPGFFSPRVFLAGLEEYMIALMDGVPLHFLDFALKRFGFTTSFASTVDHFGVDVILESIQNLKEVFPEYNTKILDELINEDALGYKKTKGFFKYDCVLPRFNHPNIKISDELKKITKPSLLNALYANKYVERIFHRMVYESLKCYADGAVYDIQEAEVAAIYGVGFPYEMGGPFSYVDKISLPKFVCKLEDIERQTKRSCFSPNEFLIERSNTGKVFLTN